jgi:hypothetical protein
MMSHAGGQFADSIRYGLTCPGCEYPLRGLPGDVVSRPECGSRCDVVKLVRNRWTKPWWQVPYLNRLSWPTIVAMAGLFFTVSMLPMLQDWLDPHPPWEPGKVCMGVLGAMSPSVLMWLWAMSFAKRAFAGWEGFWLALMMHGVFISIFWEL